MKKLPLRHLQELRPIAADTFVAATLMAALYLAVDGIALLLYQ